MVTEKDILKAAALAKLEISREELPVFIKEMQRMLDFAETINVTEQCCKCQNATPLDFSDMREDAVSEAFTASEILSNAKESECGLFKLRKRA